MEQPHILRVPRSDEEKSYILVHASSAASRASRPLDLRLTATEGEEAYTYDLQHKGISKLKVSQCPCSDEEWESCLSSILLGQQPIGDVEASATVLARVSITVTFKKRVSGLAQRLGALQLAFNQTVLDSVSLYDWCGAAVSARDELRKQLADAERKLAELEQACAKTNADTQELIRLKDEHESGLLAGLKNLVNEKKVYIRQQARMNPAPAAPGGAASTRSRSGDLSEERPPSPGPSTARGRGKSKRQASTTARRGAREAGPSRRGKRKVVTPDESSEDDGFEKMDVDKEQHQDGPVPSGDDDVTTEGSATESDPEPEEEEAEGNGDRSSSARKKDAELSSLQASRNIDKPPSANLRDKAPAEDSRSFPAPRTLPFATKPVANPAANPTAQLDEGSETESDDEL